MTPRRSLMAMTSGTLTLAAAAVAIDWTSAVVRMLLAVLGVDTGVMAELVLVPQPQSRVQREASMAVRTAATALWLAPICVAGMISVMGNETSLPQSHAEVIYQTR